MTNQKINDDAKKVLSTATLDISFIERDELKEILGDFVISIEDVLDFRNELTF